LALVGSYARGEGREDSDIDFVLLVNNPRDFCAANWLAQIDWQQLGVYPSRSEMVQYGVTWSRHVLLDNGAAIELCFAPLSWASTCPLDAGTRRVISEGCQILYDPDDLFCMVCAHVNG
jgi:hypothetical protein